MLRSDLEVRLTDLGIALRDSAAAYREAAGLAGNAALRDLFATLAARRGAAADRADAHVRRLDALPELPDPERGLLEHWRTRLRLALAADADRRLVADRRREDAALAGTVRALLAAGPPRPTADLARVLDEELGATVDTLGHLLGGGG